MNQNDIYTKAFNSLIGLAIGDALNWNSLFHRGFNYPFWTRRLRRDIEADHEKHNIIKSSLPFSLNQQSGGFHISPTDDTEWIVFNMNLLNKNKGVYDYNNVIEEWKSLSKRKDEIRGSISIISALDNISKKKNPPISGRDNPHYFDDAALVRSIPIVLAYYNDLNKLFEIVEKDASITNSLEGVESALIYAELLYLCLNEKEDFDIINHISQKIFNSKWIDSLVKRALELFLLSESLFDLIPMINNKLVDNSYNYGSAAPINLSVLIVLLKYYDGDFSKMLLTANAITKSADSTTPLLGALIGAKNIKSILSSQWKESIRKLNGICFPEYKDLDFLKLVDSFIDTSVKKNGDNFAS